MTSTGTPVPPPLPPSALSGSGPHPPPALDEGSFALLRQLLYQRTGILLKPSKQPLMQNRLRRRLTATGAGTWADYYAMLSKNGAEMGQFIDALTTNETFFLREQVHWDFFAQRILPERVGQRRSGRRQLAVWSAAASTGEELYTAAIVLLETLADPSNWELRLVGSDLNAEVIRKAREGIYGTYALRNLPETWRNKYFDPVSTNPHNPSWRIKSHVRSLCSFVNHNLQRPFSQQGFDLVLCRNVFIYFDQKAKQQALAHLVPATAPGGYLFFSHTESLIPDTRGLERVQPSIYRRTV